MSICKRDAFADRKGPFEHFTPRALLIQSLQAVALTAAPIVAAAAPAPGADSDEEEDADLLDWAKLEAEMANFKTKAFLSFLRLVSCTSLKRLLDAAFVRCFPGKTAAMLLKDASKSAIRKRRRLQSRAAVAGRMVRTAAYANVVSYSANLLIDEGVCLGQYVLACRRDRSKERDHRTRLRAQTKTIAAGYVVAYSLATLGMGLGSYVRPGLGTVIGGAIGDLAGLLLF